MLDKTHVEIIMSEYIDLGYDDYDRHLSRQLQSCFARLVYMADTAKYDCKRKLIDSAIDSRIMYCELVREKVADEYVQTGDEINASIDAKTDGENYADHMYHDIRQERLP